MCKFGENMHTQKTSAPAAKYVKRAGLDSVYGRAELGVDAII